MIYKIKPFTGVVGKGTLSKPEQEGRHLDNQLTKKALSYHSEPKPGKIEVTLTKPTESQADLSLAYTPGVAEPVRAIEKSPDAAFDYTIKGYNYD